jgi:hypothetical protein
MNDASEIALNVGWHDTGKIACSAFDKQLVI